MKQKKDILVVYIITKLELGGAQKVCLTLFRGMEAMKTHLITASDGYFAHSLRNDPSVTQLQSLSREVGLRFFWQEIRCFFAMVAALRRLKKEDTNLIVHTHSTKAGLLGRWAAFFARIPIRVHTVHGYAFHDHQPRIIWWAIYFLELVTSVITTHFICVSAADAKTGIDLFPYFTQKHSIIRAAVDWQQFAGGSLAVRIKKEKELFVFGSIGCFKPQKNSIDLLKAFAQVHAQRAQTRLAIIGDGILRPTLERFIDDSALGKVILLHGWQQNVAPIMRAWDAFVLTSLWEGLPCAVVEARLQGLPVVSYDTGGIREVIFHQYNGELVPQRSWQEFAERMLNLVEDRGYYTKLAQSTVRLDEFNDRTMIKRHDDLYRRLVAEQLGHAVSSFQ